MMSHGVCNASEAARRKEEFDDVCRRIYKEFKHGSPFDQ